MRKKFLLMLTVLVIALGGSGKLFAEGNVAKVGNTEYATINEAIANWTNGTTLTLLADVTLSDVIQLSSTEMHTLDLSSYTMTAASKKDAIQIVNNGRSSASYALDIKADATNPGGITATGKAVVRTTGKSDVKDRPIIRFYNGVFTGSYVVYHNGSNGTNCPQFQFHGGVFDGTIYTNRTLNQFYGGTFNGSLQMSVDSSAYTLIAGGTFKQLSNLYGSALNSGKFTIGSAKGVYDKEVYIDDNGNYVIAAAEPTQGIEADVAKTPGTNDYLKYSKVGTEGQLPYTNVEMALKNNTSAKVTVYAEEVDMTGINFKGTIVVPEGKTVKIKNAPEGLKTEGNVVIVKPVAKIGETYYETFDKAYEEAKNGDEIELFETAVISKTMANYNKKTITVNANGLETAFLVIADVMMGTFSGMTINTDGTCITLGTTAGDYQPTVDINGGTYNGGTSAITVVSGLVRIADGVFSASNNENTIVGAVKNVNVNGGKFYNFDPTQYIPNNRIAQKGTDGYWTVAEAAAKIGDVKYADLTSAIDAAQAGETVTLLRNINLGDITSAVIVKKSITIDGNGYWTITVNSVNDSWNNAAFAPRGPISYTFKNLTVDLKNAASGMAAFSMKYGGTLENVIVKGEFAQAVSVTMAYPVTVTNCKFDGATWGVYANASNVKVNVTGTTFNTTGALYLHQYGELVFTDNIISADSYIETNATVDVSKNFWNGNNAIGGAPTAAQLKGNNFICDTYYAANNNGVLGSLTDNGVDETPVIEIVAGGETYKYGPSKLSLISKLLGSSAQANEVKITLLEDITLENGLQIASYIEDSTLAITPKTVEINLGGKTLTGFIQINANVTATIKNGTVTNTNKTLPGVDVVGKVTLDKVTINATNEVRVSSDAELIADAKIGKTYYATLENAIDAATDGAEVVILEAGTYTVPSGKNLTITGAVAGVEFGPIGEPNLGMKNYTFNNVTFNYANDSHYKGLQYAGEMVYNNCTFNGQVFLYGKKETFTQCTFNQTTNNYNVWTYGAKEVAFNECTFYSAGKSVLIYHESATVKNIVSVAKSTFIASQAVEGKAAIEMDSSLTDGIELTIDGETTATGFAAGNVSGNSLWNNKKGDNDVANSDITVVVDGDEVLSPKEGGTWGGIDWLLSKDGVLTIAPTTGTPVADKNYPARTYKVGAWREAVRYNSKGEGVAIEGWPYDRSKVKTLVIEEGVISIGSFAAQSFTNLTGEVVIPSTVKYIGQEAFQKSTMTKLTFASVPTGETGEELCIAQGAFKNLIIKEVSLPTDRPVHLHAWVFNNCHKLENATMPATVVSVHGTNHIDYNNDFNAHSNPTWTKSSEIFAYNENMKTVTFGSEEVMDMFYANSNGTSLDYLHANVGLVTYGKIEDALAAAAESGQELSLIKNATAKEQLLIENGETVVIDLNGKTMTGSIWAKNANLTVKNGTIKNTDASVSGIEINAGTLTLETTVTVESARHALRIDGAVVATVNGGTYKSAQGTGTGTYHAANISGNANVTINGGTFVGPNGNATTTADSGSAINVQSGASVIIKNGTYKGGKTKTLSSEGTLVLYGGKYDQDPTAFVAENYMAEQNTEGLFEVVETIAKIGETPYASLQSAVNAVKDGETITLINDVTENVKLTEKVDLYYTINGDGKTMNGKIDITPLSDENDNRRITIKNINFVNTADAAVDFISCVVTNHYPRLTVEGCDFTGNGKDTDVALRLKTAYGAVIKDCTGTGLHSFLQNTAGKNFAIENVKVTDSKSGLALGTVQGVTVKECNINVAGYGIRMDAQYNNNAVIESNTIEAFIPVVVRKAEVDGNITFKGTNKFDESNEDGYWCVIGAEEYETNGKLPTAAKGRVSVVVNSDLPQSGLYGNYVSGTLSVAYTATDGYWGECGGNANYSFEFKFFNGETFMGSTSLNDVDNIINGNVNVTWNMKLDAVSNTDQYWTMAWQQAPTIAMQPNRVEQWVDGVKVAECEIQPNGPDNLEPIVAAVAAGEDLVIKSFATSLEAAVAAAEGNTVVLLKDINETLTVVKPTSNINIDGNGKTVKGGMSFGSDDNKLDNYSIVVSNVKFEGKGLSVKELTSVKINKNTFVNITEGNAITVICDGLTETVNVIGNTINNVSVGTGIRIRNAVAAVVDGNNIDGTFNNAILLEGTTSGDVYVTNNVLTNWGKDTVEKGRAIRIAKGAGTKATITGNAMTHDNAPEQFVKVSANTENVNINENYWNGKNPAIEGLFDVANAYPENYYSDADLTKLETINYVAKIGDTYYATLAAAFKAVTDDNQTVVICKDVTENLTGAYLRGNITTENDTKVTINLTNSDWVYCPYTFVLGENITLNVPALFYYAGGTQINGTLVVDAYYQRYAGTKLTINEPGSMTVNTEQFYLRYMESDANAGIYVVGDNNDETVGLNLSVAYFYQGMINAMNANIKAGTYWQTNETDGQGSANLVLDNSTLTVTVNENNAKATGNSTVTLKNGATMTCAGGLEVGADANFNVEGATMKVAGKFTNNGTVNYTDATVELAKLDNDKLMFLNGDMTIKVEDATGSSYAIRANDNVVFNNSYVKGTANETVRLLGSATFNGGFQCSYLQGSSAGVGGTVTIAENTTVKATYGIEFSKDYVLNGGTLELSGGNAGGSLWGCVFQSGEFTLNTDVVVTGNTGTYAPIYFTEAKATVNGNITQSNTGGEPIYINTGSEVTFAETSTVTTDCSVYVLGTLYGQGNVYGKITKAGDSSKIELTGGVYTQDVIEFCAEGYTAVKNADGKTWTVGLAVAIVNNVAYINLQEAIDAAGKTETTITITADFETDDDYTIASGQNITLDLNGKTITGIDNATGSFGLFNINSGAALTINDGNSNSRSNTAGAITLKATEDREWSAYSSVISNQRGTLVVNGGTIEHLGGTAMAYGIDNLTNTGAQIAETTINGGTVKSTYRAIRQFLNSSAVGVNNILTVNGGTIEGTNKSIWMQDANANANPGTLTIEENAVVNGDVYLTVTAGSTQWPVTVVIAAEALKDGSEVLTNTNVPEGYLLVNENDYYSVKTINEIDQTISLKAGWTWTSLFVDATSAEDLDNVQDQLGENGVQIKNQTSATTRFDDGWYGKLQSLSVGDMYMVKVEEEQTVTINDYQVNPADYTINLVNNWTWIGFPAATSMTLDVLDGIEPVTGDQIKTQDAYATYMAGYGWYGSLKQLTPGRGYMYKNVSGAEKQLTYPSVANYRGVAPANITAASNLMVPNMSKYANNMNITAVVNIDGEELMTEGFEVAVFAGNELRGSARPIYIEEFNRNMLFLTVYGEETEELTFKYYDLNSGKEFNLFADNEVVFEVNATLGSLEDAIVLSRGALSIDETSANSFNVYPNPVNRDNAIRFETTYEKVEVYNSLGVVVAEYANVDQISGIEAAGIYVIKVANDNVVKYSRVIVK